MIPEEHWPVLPVLLYFVGGESLLLLAELWQNKSKGHCVCRGVQYDYLSGTPATRGVMDTR